MKRTNKYIKISKVGSGTFGTVYKAEEAETGEIFALKKIRIQSEDEGIPRSAIREISLVKELQHKNIVKLIDIIHTSKKLMLIFEFIDHDLKRVIDRTCGEGLGKAVVKVQRI
jgi:serine/threonine protein kinase